MKGTLLLAVAMAVCALAMSSPASAASWGVIGTQHALDSPNLGFTMPSVSLFSFCAAASFVADVASAAALRITDVTIKNCTAASPLIGHCTVTPVATNLPWTATGTTATSVQIHGINIDWRFETLPGSAPGSCLSMHNQSMTWTGTLTGSQWTGNGSGQHEIIVTGSAGVVAHGFVLTNNIPVTWLGTFRDTSQTLTLT